VRQWTTTTPDGRRVIVRRHPDGWTVACGDSETGLRDRLESAVIEAVLMDHDFVLHSVQFDYAVWSGELVDEIEGWAAG
jgi:hypothetical protein